MDAPPSTDIALFEGFRLDRRSGALFRRDQRGVYAPVAIGSRALDILRVLVERPEDLVSRAEILAAVWPGTVVEDSNLNVQIAALRRVLDDGGAGEGGGELDPNGLRPRLPFYGTGVAGRAFAAAGFLPVVRRRRRRDHRLGSA